MMHSIKNYKLILASASPRRQQLMKNGGFTFEVRLKNVEEKMNNTQEKLQRNYVTILGIFAAIVFTFAAGTSFTSSVLETMASVSIYRLILMVALLAFVLFNSIYALFLFICRVSKFNEGKHLPKIICITDFVLLICIISTFFAWDGQFLTH